MIKNFGNLIMEIIILPRLVFYLNFKEMLLTLKYVTVFAGLFFHKFENSYHLKLILCYQ